MSAPSTKDLIADLRADYVGGAGQTFDLTLERYAESPIEGLFLGQMLADGWDFPSQTEWSLLTVRRAEAIGGIYTTILCSSDCACMCLPQQEVEYGQYRYRIDFAFVGRIGTRNTLIAVELDGHDFHERTKEQASKDKRRDRVLAANGWTVLRFTGSDVYRDPYGVLSEVTILANKMSWDTSPYAPKSEGGE